MVDISSRLQTLQEFVQRLLVRTQVSACLDTDMNCLSAAHLSHAGALLLESSTGRGLVLLKALLH